MCYCNGINDLSPLKDCLNLEELAVSDNDELLDDSFKVFSEEPNSFPSLRVLDLSDCNELTKKVFEHLAKNNHLVYQLQELEMCGMSKILASSKNARNNLCQLKGLRRLNGLFPDDDYSSESASEDGSSESPLESLEHLKRELLRELKNLDDF